jgi:arsenite methyltransferase
VSTIVLFGDDTSRRVEAIYRTPDIVATRLAVLEALNLRSNERVIDLGSGPGLLAYDMAATVGSGGMVAGVDLSDSMLEMSRGRCVEQPWVEFHNADVARLPFADGSFDAAAATQVYAYVAELDSALAELHRVLRPGGRAAILDTDFASLVWHCSNHERMARVRAAYDRHCAHPNLPRILIPRLRANGLEVTATNVVPIVNIDCHADTYSHGLIDFIRAFVVGQGLIDNAELDAWARDLRALSDAGAYFFSLNRYLFVARKPG